MRMVVEATSLWKWPLDLLICEELLVGATSLRGWLSGLLNCEGSCRGYYSLVAVGG